MAMNTSHIHAASARVEHSFQAKCDNYKDVGNPKTVSLNDRTWIVVIGASCHISNSMNCFKNTSHVSNWHVVLPNNLRLKAAFKDDIPITTDLVLYDVLFVPDFSYNLLSVTKLSNTANCELVFSSKCCVI